MESEKFDIVIDCSDCVVGRIGAHVAKKLLLGYKVALLNAERALFSGSLRNLKEKYQTRRSLKNKANPEFSPKWPRRPDLLVKRIIRGMLPWGSARGRDAYHNLRVYIGNPKNMKPNKEFGKVGDKTKYVSVEKLCLQLGYAPKAKGG
ncbi:MAG: 50S ribosomal protein L13 [Candidatus Micrarchaeia archaeon]